MRAYPYWLMTKESRNKNRQAHLDKYKSGGRKAVFKGERRPLHSEAMRELYRNGKRKIVRMFSESNPSWKKDASYSAIHYWLKNHKIKTGTCEHCLKDKLTEFANISGSYLREVNDYYELCRSCHRLYDNRKKKLFFEQWESAPAPTLESSSGAGFPVQQVTSPEGTPSWNSTLETAIKEKKHEWW